MKRTIFLILLSKRTSSAVETQKILTEFGCLIKTRLGLHNTGEDQCEDLGLVILEVKGESSRQREFEKKLKRVKGLNLKVVELKVK